MELKATYYRQAVKNLAMVDEDEVQTPELDEEEEMDSGLVGAEI